MGGISILPFFYLCFNMKNTFLFRPLRRVKKTRNIVVASYGQWRKIKTHDYSSGEAIIDIEYYNMPNDEFVYDSKGELLYWFNYTPNDIQHKLTSREAVEWISGRHVGAICLAHNTSHPHYSGKGIDCDGVPCFTHYTADYIGRMNYDPNIFEPLTVGMVKEWYGWLILRMSHLKISIK